jgi:hypothetical protein
MGRLRVGTTKTEEEVNQECPAWSHGCGCHSCRILNGQPEPRLAEPTQAMIIKRFIV